MVASSYNIKSYCGGVRGGAFPKKHLPGYIVTAAFPTTSFLFPDLSVAQDDELRCGEILHPHRAVRMYLGCADPHLRP
jgi:hypothetical protein